MALFELQGGYKKLLNATVENIKHQQHEDGELFVRTTQPFNPFQIRDLFAQLATKETPLPTFATLADWVIYFDHEDPYQAHFDHLQPYFQLFETVIRPFWNAFVYLYLAEDHINGLNARAQHYIHGAHTYDAIKFQLWDVFKDGYIYDTFDPSTNKIFPFGDRYTYSLKAVETAVESLSRYEIIDEESQQKVSEFEIDFSDSHNSTLKSETIARNLPHIQPQIAWVRNDQGIIKPLLPKPASVEAAQYPQFAFIETDEQTAASLMLGYLIAANEISRKKWPAEAGYEGKKNDIAQAQIPVFALMRHADVIRSPLYRAIA